MEQSVSMANGNVQELSSKGNSQREIARILQVGIGTINRASSISSTNPNKIPIAMPDLIRKCIRPIVLLLMEARALIS